MAECGFPVKDTAASTFPPWDSMWPFKFASVPPIPTKSSTKTYSRPGSTGPSNSACRAKRQKPLAPVWDNIHLDDSIIDGPHKQTAQFVGENLWDGIDAFPFHRMGTDQGRRRSCCERRESRNLNWIQIAEDKFCGSCILARFRGGVSWVLLDRRLGRVD